MKAITSKLRPSRTAVELHHRDCIEGMRCLDPESVDVVVTSPPYNLGIKYRNYKDDQQREAHLAWCLQWSEEIKRVLKPGGSFFLNLGGSPSNPFLPHELAVAIGQDLFRLQNTIHWIKAISIESEDGETLSKGHFKPITSHRFVNDCQEYIFHFTKTGNVPIERLAVGVPYADKSNIARWGHTEGRDVRCRGNTWFIPYKTIRDRNQERPHPATFPPELARQCIKLHGARPDLVVLDPFVGIGSAALGAQQAGARRFIGYDIDAEYLAVAAQKTGTKVHEYERAA
jgi:site-specific DNA-methyltransferase (adenine-specific)